MRHRHVTGACPGSCHPPPQPKVDRRQTFFTLSPQQKVDRRQLILDRTQTDKLIFDRTQTDKLILDRTQTVTLPTIINVLWRISIRFLKNFRAE